MMAFFSSKNHLSSSCILLIFVYWSFSFTFYKRWEKNPIAWDVVSYYGYLPATFIYNDITLHFAEKNPDFFAMKFWPEKAPNGGRVIKTAMGTAYLYTPFFLLGHLYAKISGEPQDGYSLPYQIFLQFGTLFYLLIGFIFLRKFLLNHFSDKIIALVIISIFFGTNLLYYSTREALMAHVYVFFVSSIFIWSVEKWHFNSNLKISCLLGFTMGLLVVIRPTMILYILFFLFFGIKSISSIKEKYFLFKKNINNIFLIVVFFIVPGIPQLLYWKYITGNWFFFSYTHEQFFWDKPHIIDGLFGYRNGWLLYTPIMTISIAGFFFMKEKIRSSLMPVVLITAIFIFVTHCWWCWWYGGFGLRAYIDIYSLLAIPMAAFYDYFFSRKVYFRILILLIAALLITMNIFQSWQYENGLLNLDSMTKKSYWLGFLKTKVLPAWWDCLHEPNYEMAIKGLPDDWLEKQKHYCYTTIAETSFENVPQTKDSIYFSSAYAYSGKYSAFFQFHDSYSPSINLTGEKFCQDSISGKKFVSVRFFFEDGSLQADEVKLVITFSPDLGNAYYYQSKDFYSTDFSRNEWNTISTELPTEKIKSKKDKISIYVWGQNVERKVYIDDLKLLNRVDLP